MTDSSPGKPRAAETPSEGDAVASSWARPIVDPPVAGDVTDETPTETYTTSTTNRPNWQRPAWEPAVPPTPEAWFEPAPLPPTAVRPAATRGASFGTVLLAALIAAALASAGTYVTLTSTGALTR